MTELQRRRRALMGQKSSSAHGTWADLFRAIDAGTYATEYAQGETIELDLGSTLGVMQMEISDFNLDNKADGTGKAPVTLISQNLMTPAVRFNPALQGESGNYTVGTGTIGGWKESEVRSWFINTVLPAIPLNVRSRLVEVIKASQSFNSAGTKVGNELTYDLVFCPSYRECGRNNEETGNAGTYFALNGNSKRQKGPDWGLRSSATTSNRGKISTTGRIDSGIQLGAQNTVRTLLCFCVG